MFKSLKIYFKNQQLKGKLKHSNTTFSVVLPEAHKGPSVLIVDDKLPEYDKDSGSRRLNLIIDILLQQGVQVYLMADKKEYKYDTSYCAYYQNKGVQVFFPSIDEAGNLVTREGFMEQIVPHVSAVWLHRPLVFDKYIALVRSLNPSVKALYDMVDFHYLRMKREAELKSNDSKLLAEAERFLKIEQANCEAADTIIVISSLDKQNLMPYYAQTQKMLVVGNIHDFITDTKGQKDFASRKGLLFVGSFEHVPNIDAVQYLRKHIMPVVWETLPELTVTVIGSNPKPEVLALDESRFKIVGYVNDLSEAFCTHRLFVAPLRYGAGIKGKIGQSLEFGLPLVTTPIGAEGFDFGKVAEAMIADSPSEFAQKIIAAYTDAALWESLREQSEITLQPFSRKVLTENIVKAVR
ncbi:MAG: hypothetical protein RL607_1809 [Bacteroidota bacterium]|jgi:hypothetical protein